MRVKTVIFQRSSIVQQPGWMLITSASTNIKANQFRIRAQQLDVTKSVMSFAILESRQAIRVWLKQLPQSPINTLTLMYTNEVGGIIKDSMY